MINISKSLLFPWSRMKIACVFWKPAKTSDWLLFHSSMPRMKVMSRGGQEKGCWVKTWAQAQTEASGSHTQAQKEALGSSTQAQTDTSCSSILPCWGSWKEGRRRQRGWRNWGDCLGHPWPMTNGGRGRTISASKGGARQEEEETHSLGKCPPRKAMWRSPRGAGWGQWLFMVSEKYRAPHMKVPLCKIGMQDCPRCRRTWSVLPGAHDHGFAGSCSVYLNGLLEDMNLCAIHTKCITIMSRDIQLACCICGEHLHYWMHPPP